MNLGYSAEFQKSHGFELIEKTTIDFLMEEKFGILTEIDVNAVMKKKGQQWDKQYKILGACNPPHANKVLKKDPMMGLLLPCNVIIYETDNDTIVVSLIDAKTMFKVVDIDGIDEVVDAVSSSFASVLEKLKEKFN